MEASLQSQELKRFPIDNLTAGGFELIAKLLPEWERTSGHEMDFGFRTDVGDKSWRLSFDPQLKRVAFTEDTPKLHSPKFEMRNVRTVDIDEQRGHIDFISESGMIYRVAAQGLHHIIMSPDNEVTVSLSL